VSEFTVSRSLCEQLFVNGADRCVESVVLSGLMMTGKKEVEIDD
jgi:type IV secretory pathway TrbD component